MRNFLKTAAATSAALLCATAAIAQTASPLGGYARLDRNTDGKLTAEEFNSGHGAVNKGIDTNGDKALSLDEVTKYYVAIAPLEDPKTPKRISGIMKDDANADGKVTVEEQKAADLAAFKVLDKNADGFITADELKK